MSEHKSSGDPKTPVVKRPWTTPSITIVKLSEAQGARPGPLCDKHGSLSGGKTCP